MTVTVQVSTERGGVFLREVDAAELKDIASSVKGDPDLAKMRERFWRAARETSATRADYELVLDGEGDGLEEESWHELAEKL